MASGGSWPSSLGTLEIDELIRLWLMVSPGCRLPRVFHITADGYPTRGPDATTEDLSTHHGGRWNIDGRHRYWDDKDYWAVVSELRRMTDGWSSASPRSRRCPPTVTPSTHSSCRPAPALAIAGSSAPPAIEIMPKQAVLREDGDPDDTPGYLLALRVLQTEAAAVAVTREAAELQATLQAAAAMEAAAEALMSMLH